VIEQKAAASESGRYKNEERPATVGGPYKSGEQPSSGAGGIMMSGAAVAPALEAAEKSAHSVMAVSPAAVAPAVKQKMAEVAASGLDAGQVAEIKTAIQAQQKFIGELLEHSSRWELDGMELRAWKDSDFSAAGHLIAHAYEGHLDAIINDQYRSVAGSLRFLHNIVRFPGCGLFDPAASRVLAYRGRDEIAALLLCSRVREDVGHVTQICVSRQYRRRGLGAWLLADCSRSLRSHGFQALTLTVTRENSEAVALYHRSGFITRQTFDAMVWERRTRART